MRLIELKTNKFYETWVEHIDEGKKFTEWLQNKLNIMHRLRYLLYILIYKRNPKSTIFINDSMHHSHVSFVSCSEASNIGGIMDIAGILRHKSNLDSKGLQSKDKERIVDDLDASDENDNEADWEEFEMKIKPVRNIEAEFRHVVQLLEPETFGIAIWDYIMQQLQHKQRESVWKALIIVASELPTSLVIKCLEKDRVLIRRGKLKYVEELCRVIVESCIYPMAMSLHVSKFMDENANRDLARFQTWQNLSIMFENIAIRLIYEIENDFLLALIMEMPIKRFVLF